MSNVVIVAKYKDLEQDVSIVSDFQGEYMASRSESNLHPLLDRLSSGVINLAIIKNAQKGLPKAVLPSLAKSLAVSMERLSHTLHISHRTLQRKTDNDLMSVHISEQIISISRVILRGIEVIGSEDYFKEWVHSELPALDDKTPYEYLDTSLGCEMLLKILGRIEHGVY